MATTSQIYIPKMFKKHTCFEKHYGIFTNYGVTMELAKFLVVTEYLKA